MTVDPRSPCRRGPTARRGTGHRGLISPIPNDERTTRPARAPMTDGLGREREACARTPCNRGTAERNASCPERLHRLPSGRSRPHRLAPPPSALGGPLIIIETAAWPRRQCRMHLGSRSCADPHSTARSVRAGSPHGRIGTCRDAAGHLVKKMARKRGVADQALGPPCPCDGGHRSVRVAESVGRTATRSRSRSRRRQGFNSQGSQIPGSRS